MIKVKKLVKRFGLKTVLKGMDFEVEQGEFVGLLASAWVIGKWTRLSEKDIVMPLSPLRSGSLAWHS
jgi:ABC-type uncharacterized transport system ATPase subunit